MASEIRVDKINSLSGVGTVTLSPTGIDIAGITTAATLRATTGIVTSLTAGSLTSLGAVSGTTGTFSAAVSGTTGTFSGAVSGTTAAFTGNLSITNTAPQISLVDSDNNSDFSIYGSGGVFNIYDETNSASRLTIASDGTVSVLQGLELSSTLTIPDTIVHSGDTNTKIRFPAADTVSVETAGSERFRFASDGVIHVNSSDSASGGRIWANSSALYLQSGNGRQTIKVSDASAGVNRTIEMTSAGNLAFPSGNGIDFSATSNAAGASGENEILDDFEEGNHTVGVYGSNGGSSVTLYATENKLSYTKIGNLVTLKGRIRMDAVSYSGALRISLPYTVASQDNTNNAQMCAVATHGADFDSTAGTGSHMGMFLEPLATNALAEFSVTRDNSNWIQATNTIIKTGTYLAFVLVYDAT